MLLQFGVKHFITRNTEIKANFSEKFNRTLNRLSRWMTHNNSGKWHHILDNVVTSYNNTVHRSIGMTPASVIPGELEEIAWRRQYGSDPPPKQDGAFRLEVETWKDCLT